MTHTLLAFGRVDVADFLRALLTVYTVIIFVYILTNLIFSMGARVPYSRWSDAVLGFLRDVSEPLLRPFRKIVPMLGPLDLSPILAILTLQIVGGLIIALVRG